MILTDKATRVLMRGMAIKRSDVKFLIITARLILVFLELQFAYASQQNDLPI